MKPRGGQLRCLRRRANRLLRPRRSLHVFSARLFACELVFAARFAFAFPTFRLVAQASWPCCSSICFKRPLHGGRLHDGVHDPAEIVFADAAAAGLAAHFLGLALATQGVPLLPGTSLRDTLESHEDFLSPWSFGLPFSVRICLPRWFELEAAWRTTFGSSLMVAFPPPLL